MNNKRKPSSSSSSTSSEQEPPSKRQKVTALSIKELDNCINALHNLLHNTNILIQEGFVEVDNTLYSSMLNDLSLQKDKLLADIEIERTKRTEAYIKNQKPKYDIIKNQISTLISEGLDICKKLKWNNTRDVQKLLSDYDFSDNNFDIHNQLLTLSSNDIHDDDDCTSDCNCDVSPFYPVNIAYYDPTTGKKVNSNLIKLMERYNCIHDEISPLIKELNRVCYNPDHNGIIGKQTIFTNSFNKTCHLCLLKIK